MLRRTLLVVFIGMSCAANAFAQQNRIDVVTPSAPELAPYGKYAIGARTLQVTDKNRPDILDTKEGGPTARYDRTLTLEVWYPAALAAGQKPGSDYRAITRDPAITATLHGQAVRDAAPQTTDGPFPLVIISHGYPGNRYLMSHLGENLASKGFIAVSIDHKESTYDDQKSFASTLYNRAFDDLFVLNEMDRLGKTGSGSFLAGRLDVSRTGIVGYSMYGLADTSWKFWAATPVFSLMAFFTPAIQGLMSRRLGPSVQGQLQGANGSLTGIAGMIGPLLFPGIYSYSLNSNTRFSTPGLPFLVAAGCLAVAIVIAIVTLRPLETARLKTAEPT